MLFPIMGDTRFSRNDAPPRGDTGLRHLLIGGSGIVGTVLTDALIANQHAVTVLDPTVPKHPDAVWIQGSALGQENILELISQSDVVSFLATGANSGWGALVDTEIRGLVTVLEACLHHHGLMRLIFASSNHAVGGFELDKPAYGVTPPYSPNEPVRPDGLYGAAKCFGEGVCRSASELFSLPVSILRIGTVRMNDDPADHVGDPGFARYGNSEEISSRLERSWLTHADCWRIYMEEVAASDTFRLRFATSSPGAIWSGAVEVWNAPLKRNGSIHD